jgi:hypothetical protein
MRLRLTSGPSRAHQMYGPKGAEPGGKEGPKTRRVPGCHRPYHRFAGWQQAEGIDQKAPAHSAVSHRLGNLDPDLGQSADAGRDRHNTALVSVHHYVTSNLSGMSGPSVPGEIVSARRPSCTRPNCTDQHVQTVQPAAGPCEPTDETGAERAAEPIYTTAEDLVHRQFGRHIGAPRQRHDTLAPGPPRTEHLDRAVRLGKLTSGCRSQDQPDRVRHV